MRRNDFAHDRQSESRTASGTGTIRVQPNEAIEHALAIRGGDARTVVGDADRGIAAT